MWCTWGDDSSCGAPGVTIIHVVHLGCQLFMWCTWGDDSLCGALGVTILYMILTCSCLLQGGSTVWAPSAFFGAFSLGAGLLSMFLPETRNVALDEKDGGSRFAKDNTNYSYTRSGQNNRSFEMDNTSAS